MKNATADSRPSLFQQQLPPWDPDVKLGTLEPSDSPPTPAAVVQDSRITQDNSPGTGWRSSSWIASLLTHLILLISLSLFVVTAPPIDAIMMNMPRSASSATPDDRLETFQILEYTEPDIEETKDVAETSMVTLGIEVDPLASVTTPNDMPMIVDPIDSLAMMVSAASPPARLLPRKLGGEDREGNDGLGPSGNAGAGGKGELGGRAARRIAFATPEREYAINKSLIWLARHQSPDGGWSFEHRGGECRGRCPNPGTKTGARVAATGLALLPFLGAGNSPEHGEYRKTVDAGIKFLLANINRNGNLWRREGRMYGQGIASLALCECYGIMTQSPSKIDAGKIDAGRNDAGRVNAGGVNSSTGSPNQGMQINQQQEINARDRPVDIDMLKLAATAAIQYIVNAQATDGGWRYEPGQFGDTSVVGWQVMAIKSAGDAGLGDYDEPLEAASQFLDNVQYEVFQDRWYGSLGTRYAYQPNMRIKTPATTAIGLACRIYMGTSPNHAGMEVAANRIAELGPIGGDMYYNYYANQVLFQRGGPAWEDWSEMLDTALVLSQDDRGHRDGSWFFGGRNRGGDHGGDAGGRLYTTAMACLCLEETFRHLPLFRGGIRVQDADQPNPKAPDQLAEDEVAKQKVKRDPWDFSDPDPVLEAKAE